MLMMSPYGSKTNQRGKDQNRNQRMQTMTAQKMQSTNLLSSNNKQSSKSKFELPLLSNRSNSKPTLVQQKHPLSINKEVIKSAQAGGVTMTQSHNFLPTKIGSGILA